jgi:hypothetical protein
MEVDRGRRRRRQRLRYEEIAVSGSRLDSEVITAIVGYLESLRKHGEAVPKLR